MDIETILGGEVEVRATLPCGERLSAVCDDIYLEDYCWSILTSYGVSLDIDVRPDNLTAIIEFLQKLQNLSEGG